MGLTRAPAIDALIVPDEETWLLSGGALDRAGVRPAAHPGEAGVLLVPDRIPAGLVDAVRAGLELMAPESPVQTYPAALPGVPVRVALAPEEERHGGHASHEDHEDHEGHEGHDHGDMMAIEGEASRDGLVMEDLELEAGPLGSALAGGLVVAATLDGDVVSHCDVRRTLHGGADGAPDPLCAEAWSAAEQGATLAIPPAEDLRRRLAAVEVERAIDHLAWLHRLSRLLGWRAMGDRARAVMASLVAARLDPADAAALRRASAAAEALNDALAASRPLARRTRGVARLTAADIEEHGLAGPIARASGVPADARADDEGYRALGFQPICLQEGDARARTLVRAAEAARSARLASAALDGRAAELPAPAFGRPGEGVAECARGPVRITGDARVLRRSAPGAAAARAAAGRLAAGHEWATALVVIASFDVSPWQVEG